MSTRNTIITAILTSLITSICVFFGLHFVTKPKEARMPQIVGLRPAKAVDLLKREKLYLQVVERKPSAKYPANVIIEQSPGPQVPVKQGTQVTAILSAGPPKVKVPSCTGLTQVQLVTELAKLGLTIGKSTKQESTKHKPGEIIACSPASGTELAPGAKIDFTVAEKKAEDMVEVPKFTRKSCNKAKKLIVEAGLVVGKIRYAEFEVDGWVVMKQEPKEGTKVKKGTKVDLVCNRAD